MADYDRPPRDFLDLGPAERDAYFVDGAARYREEQKAKEQHPYFYPRSKPIGDDHDPAESEAVTALHVVSAAELSGEAAPPRSWDVPGLIPGKQVTLFSGDGGVGKSLVAMQRCVAGVAGPQWFGLTPREGPCLYLSAEDDLDELWRRLEDIAASYGVGLDQLADLHLVSLAGEDAVLAVPGKGGVLGPTPIWRGLVACVEKLKPVLIVLDTAADVFARDEIKRLQVRSFIGQLRRMAIEADLAVLLLSHPSVAGINSGTGLSGSTAWNGSVRSRLYLDKFKSENGAEIDADLRTLSVRKSNYGPGGGELRLRFPGLAGADPHRPFEDGIATRRRTA